MTIKNLGINDMMDDRDGFGKAGLIAYLAVVFITGLFFSFKNTPLTGLDERFHFFRSYQISQGGILAHKINGEDGTWGGCVSDKALQYVWPFFISQDQNKPASKAEAKQRAESIDASDNSHNTCFNFAPSAAYSPLLYMPSAIGIAASRAIGMGIDGQMYTGRIANLIIYVAMVFLAVSLMPVMKLPTLFILSFPTLINLASSYSPDPVTNSVTAIFIACCLRMAILREGLFWQVFFLSGLVGLLKITNVAFLPFLMLIPLTVFSSSKKGILFIGGSMAFGLLVGAAWNIHYAWIPSQFWHSGGDAKAAMSMLKSEPVATVAFLLKSVWIQTPDMFNRMFATFGGGPQLFTWTIGGPYCRMAIMLIVASAFLSLPKKKIEISIARIALLPIMSIGSVVLIFAALWIGFSPLNLGIVAGVQGRYFATSLLTLVIFIGLILSYSSSATRLANSNQSSKSTVCNIVALVYLILITYVCYQSVMRYLPLYI